MKRSLVKAATPKPPTVRVHPSHRVTPLLALQLALFAATGCTSGDGPRPLVAGEDSCDFCKMAISDVRYGGEVRTSTGRIVTFDAVECLAGYIAAAADSAQFTGTWVADFRGGDMVPAATARYLSGGSLHSPMGRQLTAFSPNESPEALVEEFGGRVLSWPDVMALVAAPAHAAHGDQPAPGTSPATDAH